MKVRRALCLAFGALHLVAGVLAALPRPVRPMSPLLSFYGQDLRMTAVWDMFVQPAGASTVRIEGVVEDGTPMTLESSREEGGLVARARDARMRKLLGHLDEPLGVLHLDGVLAFYCRQARSHGLAVTEVRIVSDTPPRRTVAGDTLKPGRQRTIRSGPCEPSP